MSNVLIGIIGVILFIGLALAGALFLGPRFQEASNTSRASAAVAATAQIANATALEMLDSGQTPLGINYVNDLVSKGYLKSLPKPQGSLGFIVMDKVSGYEKNVSGASTKPRYSLSAFPHDKASEELCRAVEKHAGRSGTGALPTDLLPTHQTGCVDYSGDTGYGQSQFYMVYSAL